MRVVALPGDGVDTDVVAQLDARRIVDEAGDGPLPEHLAGQLVAEVLVGPGPVVGVVIVANVLRSAAPDEQERRRSERGPSDFDLFVEGERRRSRPVVSPRIVPVRPPPPRPPLPSNFKVLSF